LTNQFISHVQNITFLETNRQIQPQDHDLSQIFHSYTYNEEVDYENKDDVDLYSPLYDKVCYVDEWSNQIDEDSFDFIDTQDVFPFEDPYEVNQYFEIHNAFSNPLFQLEEINHLDIDTPIDMCTLSFDNDDDFKGIPRFLNPLYESYLYYDDPIYDRKIPKDDINIFDEFIDHIFDIQTLNLKPQVLDPIDDFNVRCKSHLVGWQVLQDGNQFFWILIGPLHAMYALIGQHSSPNSLQTINPTWGFKDAFLYAKFHLV
jgi:hypothetical protein